MSPENHTLEKQKQPDIPKSRELYSGDINDAVIAVQEITSYEITPDWWAQHVGNGGSTEEILDRFDAAFEQFVREQRNVPTDQEAISAQKEQEILDEANKEYEDFSERFDGDPEYDQLSAEFLDALRSHLIEKYFSEEGTVEAKMEMMRNLYGLEVEISDIYKANEQKQLIDSTRDALMAVDRFLGGNAKDIFKGLRIRIGEKVAAGGAEAKSEQNLITLNGRAMLMSLSNMREITDYDQSELTGSPIDMDAAGGALRYTLVHEMGHILDELTESGPKKHRVAAAESPTKYGREPDEWNSEKDHEAFAEGFAHMVYGMPVSEALAQAVRATIRAKLGEVNPA